MKRNSLIIGVIIILGILALILISRNSNSSIKKTLRDFAIEDTASVDKIFMVRKDNRQVLLTREGDHWMVNDKHLVRPDAIEILLKTLNRMRVKSPVSASMLDNAVRMIATRNTKVEVYSGKKLLKTIYVGGPTQDQMGTFMMLEGSSVPFVVNLPGFTGYLSSRFFIEEQGWRSTSIFEYDFNDIQSIAVENPDDPMKSFKLVSSGNNQFIVTSPQGLVLPGPLDTVAARYYISKFEKINFEFFADSTSLRVRDSLKTTLPYRMITLEERNGRIKKVTAWKRPANGKLDDDGNPLIWDNERMWAMLDDESWVVIQYYVFNPLFVDFNYFAKPGR